MSYTPYGVARHHPAADANGDGIVNISDYLAIMNNWGQFGTGDVNRSGQVNTSDLLAYYAEVNNQEPAGDLSYPSEDNIIGYDGYIFDEELQAYCVRFRHYIPELGRWAERDPLGYSDGFSMYRYARSRPTGSVDSFGLCSCASYRNACPSNVGDPLYDPLEIRKKLANLLPPGRRFDDRAVDDCHRAKLRLLIAAIDRMVLSDTANHVRDVLDEFGGLEEQAACDAAEIVRKSLEELFDTLDEIDGAVGEAFDELEDIMEDLKLPLDIISNCQQAADISSSFLELIDCEDGSADTLEDMGAVVGLTAECLDLVGGINPAFIYYIDILAESYSAAATLARYASKEFGKANFEAICASGEFGGVYPQGWYTLDWARNMLKGDPKLDELEKAIECECPESRRNQ